MKGNPNRLGRRAYPDDLVEYTFYSHGIHPTKTHVLTFDALVEFGYRNPYSVGYPLGMGMHRCDWTKAMTLEWLTGYGTNWDRLSPWGLGEIDWGEVRPCHVGGFSRTYWYDRDVLEAMLPHRPCKVCGRKVPRDRLRWREDRDRCPSELCERTRRQAYRLARTRTHFHKDREARLWERWVNEEHLERAWPTCSEGCHDAAVKTIRSELGEIWSKHRWARQTGRQLKQVRRLARRRQREQRQSQSAG